MDKIRTKAAATTIAKRFIAEDPNFDGRYCRGYDTDRPSFCISEKFNPGALHSQDNEIVIMIFLETDFARGYHCHRVLFYNDCTGGEWIKWMSTDEISDKFWQNRKYINSSNQLRRI